MVVTLDCERKNITGSFDCSKAPVARIADGDSVVCNVLDGDWHFGKPPVPKTGAGSFFEGKDAQRDAGHCLIGPIYVEGAKPGDTLAVRINECRTANWGWSRVGFADKDHMNRLNISELPEYFLNWDIDQRDAACGQRPGTRGHDPSVPWCRGACTGTARHPLDAPAAECRRQSGLQAGHGRKHDLSSGHVRRRVFLRRRRPRGAGRR